MQSTDIILHYTFEPGTSFVGTQLCLVYQGEASTSMLTAFAEGRGKEVSIGSFTVAIFAYFSAPFRFTFYVTFSRMTPKMTGKWSQKGSFLQNGGTPPILQSGSFSFPFLFSFLNDQSKLRPLFPASTTLNAATPFALPSHSANDDDDDDQWLRQQRQQQQHRHHEQHLQQQR